MVRFQAISWDARDVDDEYTISVFGRMAEGQSVALTFRFDPYFFVKLDQTKGAPPQPWKLYEFKDLWGFQNSNKVPFYKCDFKNLSSMKRSHYTLVKKGYKLYEANLDPVLRFMHRSGIESTGWIDVPESCTLLEDHTTDIDLFCSDWTTLRPYMTDEIAPLKVMSFDIECFSADGSFPRAKVKSNVIFQIACTTRTHGTHIEEQVCFCLGKTDCHLAKCFDTEDELLQAWAAYLVKTDPDMITGWNIFGFDLEYIWDRLGVLGAPPMDYVWGRTKNRDVELVTKELSSSALGKNILKMVPMTGRYVFDMFHTVKRDHKLEKYSLNSVSKEFLGDSKLDMPVKEIFGRFLKRDPKELGEVAMYCIKDTELPLRLMDRLFVLPNMIEMARATWVPLSFLSERGQQIKVFSQICRKARDLGFLVPTIPYGSSNKFEGATVLEPETGAYYSPITALDFASLYPSIMCAHNMCYSTIVTSPEYDNLPGIEYEQFGSVRFAQNVPSLLPVILTELKAFRKKAKRDMALHEGTPLEHIYNSRQLAYKISMNSVYGFTGAQKGILPLVDIASSVTMKGRSMIQETKEYIEKNFPGAHVRYGDSVAQWTPVTLRKDGKTIVKYICNLGDRDKWEPYEGFLKEGSGKQMCNLEGWEAWTHLGWSPIKRVIRHKCDKQLFNVITPSGSVVVTEDHSLLGPSLELLKPKDIGVGCKLYHSFPLFDNVQYVGPETYREINSVEDANIRWPRKVTYGGGGCQYHLLYLKLSKFGLNVTITKDGCLSWTERKKKRDPFEIIKIEPTDGFNQKNSYVYDLETEAGTFQAGVGSLIVKNTDSVMIEFHTGLEGQTAIEESWRLGERASKECSALFKKPNELELEKVYCPYILYSKKRYAAKMFEKKGSDVVFKKIDVKGLQVVRRDSCPFVRDVCSSILDEILNTMDPAKAIQFAKKSARLLLQGKVPIEKLVLSRQLGSDYKSDNLAHVAVRDRMRQRAPGSEPMQGDRVQYVITDRPGKMYEKAEDPVWVAEHKLKVDYKYYMKHQLENPVLELLQPLIGNVNIFDNQNLISTFYK